MEKFVLSISYLTEDVFVLTTEVLNSEEECYDYYVKFKQDMLQAVHKIDESDDELIDEHLYNLGYKIQDRITIVNIIF